MASQRLLWTLLRHHGAPIGVETSTVVKSGSSFLGQNAGSFREMSCKVSGDNDLRGLSATDDSRKESQPSHKAMVAAVPHMFMSSLGSSKLASTKAPRVPAIRHSMLSIRFMSSAPAPVPVDGKRTETGVVKGFHDNPLNPAAVTWWPSLFLGIVMGNLIGRLPAIGADGALTGALGVTLGMSFTVWTAWTIMGLANSGTKFFKLFIPGGSPPVLAPVFAALELVSYSFRAISLGVRLWANMFSGHTLLHILTSMCLSLVFCLDGIVRLPVSIALFTLLSALVGLEWLILVLQAGVFVMLSSFYAGEVAEIQGDDD